MAIELLMLIKLVYRTAGEYVLTREGMLVQNYKVYVVKSSDVWL